MPAIEDIKRIAEIEFSDIVKSAFIIGYKLRLMLADGSFVDIYLSQRLPDRFGFHWECRDDAETIYRYDNVPDVHWKAVASFPHHFHNGSQHSVEASPFPLTTLEGFRAFMDFVRTKTVRPTT